MRVLFVNPHYTHDPLTLLLHPPLCYGYMSNALKANGHDVIHADLPFEGNRPEVVATYLDDYRPDLVGVTSVAQSYYHALEIARVVKEWDARTPVVFGGPHTSFIGPECLSRHRDVDFVLLFDAEHSIVELVSALGAGGDTTVLGAVPGLVYRDGDAIRTTPPDPPSLDLDQYGMPDRSIFDMERYAHYDYETVVMTARGCPSRCTFCSTTAAGRAARWNGPKHVCDELEQVIDLGFSSVFFGDDTFSGDPRRAIAICEEIVRRDLRIPWTSNMRAQDARPQVLDAMREAGAYRVFVGYESIQQRTLRLVKKGTSPERLYKTANRIMAHGLELHASFIVGAPGDTHETLAATLDFIRLINPTVATFNVMEPRPGTDVYRNPDRYGIAIPDPYWYETTSWLDLPVCATENLSQEEIRDWVHRCYDEFCGDGFRRPEVMERLEPTRAEWDAAADKVQRHLPILSG
ncbi:B12-binding domain-containing radical SAM protein [Nonomuraea turcica]|uniref:B12-binding domain-containing radical SAM protein n=1 Tax=Nonomuraea sp. G32 TaxID=3067274 RepID=UPI00273C75BA|nr:radical SAM protein [Nonomuraea sp. G32]MDP4500510.1 radical SAM protein [Nonomuraea sp. G32]